MKAPQTYAEWMEILTELEKGVDDENILRSIKAGSLSWQAGVAERFTRTLSETVDLRMNKAIDKFNNISRRGDLQSLVRGIASLRKEFLFLAEVMNLSFIPEDTRVHLINNVVNASNQVQSSLEHSSKHDRTGRLSSIIRNNKISIEGMI